MPDSLRTIMDGLSPADQAKVADMIAGGYEAVAEDGRITAFRAGIHPEVAALADLIMEREAAGG